MAAWRAFMDKFYPNGDKTSTFPTYGYAVSSTLAEVLKRAGDNLTRENVMKQAASMKDLEIPCSSGHQDQHQRDRLLSAPVGPLRASRARPGTCSATCCRTRLTERCRAGVSRSPAAPTHDDETERAAASPPPLWGGTGCGGITDLESGFPPPLAPPHKGEGNPRSGLPVAPGQTPPSQLVSFVLAVHRLRRPSCTKRCYSGSCRCRGRSVSWCLGARVLVGPEAPSRTFDYARTQVPEHACQTSSDQGALHRRLVPWSASSIVLGGSG